MQKQRSTGRIGHGMSQKVRIGHDDMNSLALIPSLEWYWRILALSATTVEKPATLVQHLECHAKCNISSS